MLNKISGSRVVTNYDFRVAGAERYCYSTPTTVVEVPVGHQ